MGHILARPLVIMSVEAGSVIAVIMRHVHSLGLGEVLALMVAGGDLVVRVPLNLVV